jgi:iron complex outermembrane receptor protein
VCSCIAVAALLATLGSPLLAQQGAIAGRVTNASTLVPVPLATIRVVAGGAPRQVVSERDGSYELRLVAGVYDLLVEATDFAPTRFERIRVSAGQTTTLSLPLESQGFRLAGFIVTASRGTVEREITAPSSSHIVRGAEIEARPVPSPVEHLRESPGVDIGTHGLQSSNVVVRGFNNIFSGALHMLADNRLAGLPSLRVNFMHYLPPTEEDVERVEVVLGPGSALYGPNTANGVVHLITKSPLDHPGSSITLGAGERSLVQGSFRTAHRINDRFGVKLSGQLLRGEEWPYVDPVEQRARERADAEPDVCRSDLELRGYTPGESELACGRVGIRDSRVRRYGLEARADWRFSRRGALVGTYGISDVSGVELTGLSAVQTRHWVHQFVQGRLEYDRWFVQAYFNANDSGEAYFLREGIPLVDRSSLGVVQAQNGFSLADGRQDFTYGFDYFANRPDSRSTIYGDFESDNDIDEWGIYVQSKTAISPRWDFIAAGRVDSHSILPDLVFSPRVAVVFKPDERNAVRLAFNRAFSTPTALNYFLDLSAGVADDPLGALRYTTRAFGSGRNGFAWQNADGTLRGMRSPFNPDGAGRLLTADEATLWRMGVAAASDSVPIPPDVLAVLRGLAPGASDVDMRYTTIDGGSGSASALNLPDVPPVRETRTETVEVGWSGVFENTLRISMDVYYRRESDFVSPLTVETPLLSFGRDDLEQWLGPAYVDARVADLVAGGMTEAAATAQATLEASQLVPRLADGIGGVPLAVVSSDVPELENGGADLIATYRNLGALDLWGGDVAIQWFLSPEWTLTGTYSHVSENWFRLGGGVPLALNAPANKGTLGLAYRNAGRGIDGSARVRYTASFPFLSTNFDGTRCLTGSAASEPCIDEYALVDLTLGYGIPGTAATVQLGVINALDTAYRSFVGVPSVGRLGMVRLRYDF